MKTDLMLGMILDEPAEKYHARREYISSSPLAHMMKSPLHFFNAWTGEVEPTPAMDRGTFIHSILLEQDITKFVARPMKDGRLVATNTKEYKDFLEANPGKIAIHPSEYKEALAILSAATENKAFMRAFERSNKEVSFYAVHESTKLPLKARPDKVCKDFSFILDVKSTSDISRFEKQIFGLGYDVRLAHYLRTIEAHCGKLIPEVYFFAIESAAPFGCKMFRLSTNAIEQALAQWDQWASEIAICSKENRWPGYADDIIDVDRPKYLQVEDVTF